MLVSRLGWGRGLLLPCMTGWLEVAVVANWGDHVERIACRNGTHRKISVNRDALVLPMLCAMTAQAILILIDCRG
jgi:hypothetical protein